ncbi:MAG TPA: hypothetical protein VGJ89_10875, partial [Geothrix sp.]
DEGGRRSFRYFPKHRHHTVPFGPCHTSRFDICCNQLSQQEFPCRGPPPPCCRWPSSLLQAQAAFPSAPPAPSPVPVLKAYPDTPAGKLLRDIKEHAEVVARVEYLADMIDPRLTGSGRLRRAQAWARTEMTRLGAVNVHEEAYDFGLAWTRGVDSARLLAPGTLQDAAAAAGAEGARGA